MPAVSFQSVSKVYPASGRPGARPLQALDHVPRRADLLERRLGVGMDVAAPLGHLRQVLADLPDHVHGVVGTHGFTPGQRISISTNEISCGLLLITLCSTPTLRA